MRAGTQKQFVFTLILAAAVPLFALLSSCEVGLGASVDTEAPTIDITYPPASAVIRGTFTLAGTCGDDKGVSGITVTAKNTGTGTSYGPYSPSITDGTSWTVSLNEASTTTAYNGWTLPDGTYEISAVASDAAGHSSGTASRTVDIDNTAPVLVLSKPLGYGAITSSNAATTYGRTIKIAGDIGEVHTVSSLNINYKLYDTSTGTLSSTVNSLSVTDFSQMSSMNPLTIARYYTTAEIAAAATDTQKAAMTVYRANYLSLYGTDADNSTTTTKTYYCGVVLTDNALTYTTVGDSGTGAGNTSSVYYIDTDSFNTSILGDNSTYKLDVTKIMKITNGTDTEHTSDELTAIKAILATAGNYASSSTITSGASSVFSVNPANNPTWEISDYALGYANNAKADATTGYREYVLGSTLYLTLNAGRDGIYVKPATVAMTIQKYASDRTTPDGDPVTLIAAGDWTDEPDTTARKSFVLASGSTYKSNCYYKITVTGADRDGNELEAVVSDGYGFKVKSSNNPPEVLFYDKDDANYFDADHYFSESTIKNTSIPVRVLTDGLAMHDTTPIAVAVTINGNKTDCTVALTKHLDNTNYYYYTITIPTTVTMPSASNNYNDKFKCAVNVTAEDSGENTGTATGYIYLDNKAPVLTVSSLSPYVSLSDSTYTVNGTVTVKMNITESNMPTTKNVTYTIKKPDGSTEKSAPVTLSDTDSFTIDTTALTDKITYSLTVSMSDAYGNTGTSAATLMCVDQSTDKPTVTLTNANNQIHNVATINAAYISSLSDSSVQTNIFGKTSNNKLVGTITDDDGISKIEVWYKKTSVTDFDTAANDTIDLSSTKPMTYPLSYKLQSEAAAYDIKIKVTDTIGTPVDNHVASTTLTVAVDDGAPLFSSVTPSAGTFCSSPFTVSGTVTDDSTITLQLTSSGAGTSGSFSSAQPIISGTAWTDSVTAPDSDGTYTLIYTATDVYGQATTYPLQYKLDKTAPTALIPTVTGWKTSSAQPLVIPAKDPVVNSTASGINTVTYQIGSAAAVALTKGTANADDSSYTNYTATLNLSEGTNTVTIAGTDNAGNALTISSGTNPITYYIDTVAPTITAAASNTKFTSKANVTISATATDTVSGVKKIALYDSSSAAVTDGSGAAVAVTLATADTSGTGTTQQLTVPESYLGEGVHTFYVRAYDDAGNYVTSPAITITVDTTAPTLAVSNLASNTVYTENNTTKSGSTYTYTISGTWYDATSGTKTLQYTTLTDLTGISVTEDAATGWKTAVTNATAAVSSAGIAWTLPVTVTEGSGKSFSFRAQDDFGNTTATTTFSGITFDLSVPVITLGSYQTLTKSDFTLTGTVTDGLALSGTSPYGVSITATKNGTDATSSLSTITYTLNDTKNASFSVPLTASGNDGKWIFTVSATDNAGRSAVTKTTDTVLIDTTAPSLVTGNSSYPITVGGSTYDANNWFNDTSLTLSGYFTEAGSGISTIYYWINPSAGSSVVLNDTSKTSGTISPNTVTGTCKFSATISGFTENSQNTIYFAAQDEAGNISTATDSFSVNIDKTEPTITLGTPGTVLSNAGTELVFTGTVTDTPSGVNTSSISATKGTIAYDTGATTYRLTLSTTILSGMSDGINTVNATVKDKAGNSYTGTIATLNIDKTDPTVSFTSPTAGTTVNKTITVSGTASDTGGFNYATLWISTDNGSNYIQLLNTTNNTDNTSRMDSDGHLTLSDSSWSYLIDTTAYNNTTTTSSLMLKVTGYDKAGNSAQATRSFTIDQNTDRPVVKVTSISASGGALMYGDNASITGAVTDDDSTSSTIVNSFAVTSSLITSFTDVTTGTGDGTAKSFTVIKDKAATTISITVASGSKYATYKESGTDASGNTIYGYDITIFDPVSGDFTFTPYDVTDGTKSMYFCILDNNSALFSTANSSQLARPYLKFKSGAASDNTAAVTYVSDSTAPAISAVGGSYGSTDSVGTVISSLTTSTTLGGTAGNYMKFTVTASDANGIAGMALKVTKAGSTTEYLYSKATAATIGSVTGLTADSGGSFTANKTSTANTWTTAAIDLSAAGTGIVTVTATVYDQSGLYSNSTSMFYTDNTAPAVTITAPGTTDSDWITSTTTIKGTAADTGTAGVASIEWIIPTVTQQTAYKSGTVPADSYWKTLTSKAAISIAFDSTVSGDTANIITYANSTYASTTGSDVWKVPYYFRITDTVGNSYIDTTHYVIVDVDGGKPTAKILYPETDGTIGGTFTVYGTAVDDVSVSYVKVQIDTDGDGDFDATDYTNLATAANNWGFVLDTNLFAETTSGANDWYVKAEGTASWKLSVNTSSITGSLAKLGIRVAAVDGAGNTRTYATTPGTSYVSVNVDQQIPKVTSLMLVQYSDFANKTISRERTYTSGMYISNNIGKKQWYLVGTLSDDGYIKSVSTQDVSGTNFTIASTDLTTSVTLPASAQTSVIFYVKMPSSTTETGKLYEKLSVTDNDNHTYEQYITVNLDNTAPSMYNTSGTATTEPGSALRLTHSSANVSATNVVANDNYLYEFGDTVKENDSGLAYLAFYFKRAGSSVTKVLCPMYDNYTNTGKYATINTSISSGTASGDTYINTDGLACVYLSGTRSAVTTFTDTTTITSDNYNIRVGNLVKIGGMYTKITAVDTSTKTITLADDVDTSFTTAELIYAQVVDHVSKESVTGNTSVDPSTDDGDGMIESLTSAGAWTASIQSDYLTDGPVELHVVAIDAAGNISTGSVTTSVQNHRPRLTKVLIGTDLNGNGKFDYNATAGGTATTLPTTAVSASARTADGTSFGEFSYYSALGSSGTTVAAASQAEATIASSSFTVKDKLCVLPEFVGGNTSLAYTFTAGATAGSASGAVVSATAATAAITTVGSTWASDATSNLYTMATAATITATANNTGTALLSAQISDYGGIIIPASDLIAYESDSAARYFAFTFWDQTDETTQGKDSEYALLVMPVKVDVTDTTAPTTGVDNFYWKSATDNSVYTTLSGTAGINGHIELPADLNTTTFSQSSGEYDTDPKVSGYIRITGTAYDDRRLRALTVSLAGLTITPYSTYTAAGAEQTLGSTTQLAVYVPGTGWVVSTPSDGEAADLATDGWTFSVTDASGPTQSGHSVTWEFDIDTSKLSGIADVDKAITAAATDSSNNSATAATLRVDVVPYITSVRTALSTLNTNKPSVYDRTALGHYPVSSTKSAYFTGYNLTTSAGVYLGNGTTAKATTDTSTDTSTFSGYTCYPVSASALTSGSYSIEVNSVRTLNNQNTNNACGTYTSTGKETYANYVNFYNRLPNDTNNDLLTDDVVLDVWGINSSAAAPISGRISDPVMKINPDFTKAKGLIGFAFTNGPLYFSMGGVVSSNYYSYYYWQGSYDFMSSIGFGYDSTGHSYGFAAGGDINSSAADNFNFMTDRWGVSGGATDGSYVDTNALGLESVGQKGLKDGSDPSTIYFDKTRIQSPSFASTRYGTTGTDLYLAYYDDLNDEIRFKYGSLLDSKTTAVNFGNFVNAEGGTNNRAPNTYAADVQYVSVLNTGAYKPGEYVSVGVVPGATGTGDETVVIVWYDAVNNKLMYMYSKNPTAGNSTAGVSQSTWVGPTPLYTGGQYCQIAVDVNKGIHIASYDNSSGDLKYTYLATYDTTYSAAANTCIVDSEGIVGSNITLDTALVTDDGSTYYVRPYIGYYALSCVRPKYAYKLTAPSADMNAGASSDYFTQKWEVTLLPTSSTVPQDRINVGVWKNSSSQLAYSTADGTSTGTVTASNSSNKNYGWCYGNGTNNAVLGYQIKVSGSKGTIETAQMK